MSDVSAGSARETGKVKFFNSRNGYGFILPDKGGQDVFLSVNSLPKGISAVPNDQRCSFVRGEGKKGKGPEAKEVQLL